MVQRTQTPFYQKLSLTLISITILCLGLFYGNTIVLPVMFATSIPTYGMRFSSAASKARKIAYLIPRIKKPMELSVNTMVVSIIRPVIYCWVIVPEADKIS